MKKIEFIIDSIVTLISITTTLISFIQKRKTQTISSILRKVPYYVIEAENIFGAGNGQAKFSYVANKIQIDCVKARVKISDEEMATVIEDVLSTPSKKISKEINIQ